MNRVSTGGMEFGGFADVFNKHQSCRDATSSRLQLKTAQPCIRDVPWRVSTKDTDLSRH